MKSRSKSFKKRTFNLGNPTQKKSKNSQKLAWIFLLVSSGIVGLLGGLALLLSSGIITIGGIPGSMIWEFLQDPIAVQAFTSGERKKLHNRLEELGFEEEIKDFYRPRIRDEAELDRYIHQLMYYWSGYVGANYQVNSQGELELKPSKKWQ